jgi:hypothetical protein
MFAFETARTVLKVAKRSFDTGHHCTGGVGFGAAGWMVRFSLILNKGGWPTADKFSNKT